MRIQTFTLVLMLASLVASIGCEKPDDVTQIRAIVDQAVDAAKRQDIKEVMEFVTDDFRVNPGDRDEQAARSILLIALRTFGKFDIRYPVPAIKIAPDAQSAQVNVPFLIVRESVNFPDVSQTREDPARWLEAVGDALGDPYRLKMDFTKSSGEWKVREATLQSRRTLGSGGRF
jgi:hypothetical protein